MPITPEARVAIDALPAAPIRWLITIAHGKPCSVEGLGNRFRKSVSRQLAGSGVISLQPRAVTGHKKADTFARYAAKANRRTLADAATARLIGKPHLANPDNSENYLVFTVIREGWWWTGLDSNQRTLARADLQSAAFNHSATCPHQTCRRRVAPRFCGSAMEPPGRERAHLANERLPVNGVTGRSAQ